MFSDDFFGFFPEAPGAFPKEDLKIFQGFLMPCSSGKLPGMILDEFGELHFFMKILDFSANFFACLNLSGWQMASIWAEIHPKFRSSVPSRHNFELEGLWAPNHPYPKNWNQEHQGRGLRPIEKGKHKLKCEGASLSGHLPSYLTSFLTNFWVYHLKMFFYDFRKLNSIQNYVFWCLWHPRAS